MSTENNENNRRVHIFQQSLFLHGVTLEISKHASIFEQLLSEEKIYFFLHSHKM